MFLVELVMQGVRGFQQLVRLRFQGGFNFIAAGNETGKTTSVDSISRLLFPVNDAAKMNILVSRATPDASRGALVVYSDDGSYYRVIQDFSKAAINLSKYNASTKEFALQNKDWESSASFMDSLHPAMSEDDYAGLFIFRPDAYGGGGWTAQTSATARPAEVRPAATLQGRRSAAEGAKLAELKEALLKSEEAADAEYKAEAARIRLAEIAKKLERLDDSNGRVVEIEEQLAELKVCEELPANIDELIQNYEEADAEKAAKLNELENDVEGLTVQRDTLPAANMLKEKLFIAGLGVGGMALILGIFILSDEQALFFPILIMAAILLLAAGWYNSSRKNAQRTAVQKEIDELVKERAVIEKKYRETGAEMLRLMQATSSQTAGEVKEKADNYRHFLSLYTDLQEQQRMALGGEPEENVRAEYAKLQEEVAGLEQAEKELSRFAVDSYGLRQEIERLEGKAAAVAPADFDSGGSIDFGGDEFAPATAVASAVQSPIALASNVSGIEMETLIPAVESAAQRNVSAVSGGRYVKIEVGHDGHPLLQDSLGAKYPLNELSHGTASMASFCLHAAIVEAIAGKRRLPYLLDDPFTRMDPARQQAACQVLRALGKKTQVILFTSNSALKASTDAASELK